ncbi:class I SAM-dependent methyltransferase [Aliikangiella coralliicola]|uniref:Class I SAM-dependent methyltransferase n=1 Tax=Aliikangiella coralliicola TaxID=2592383 RepID=A0A545UDH0_9GAMM|nr:class I SAM-dependent methyltransferase [Aliikangiella coralliicola]TQV87473.1 class I SAM-dependent methyltransferase [Aliikangiella coralliicola]
MKNFLFVKFIYLTLFLPMAYAGGLTLTERSGEDLTRDKTSKPIEIIQFAGVKTGQRVLDLLGGGGYYSELLSQAVGSKGSVVLHNNQAYIPYIGKELEGRLGNNRLKNVTRLMSEASSLKLGESQFDFIFLVLGYHDFYVVDKNWKVSADQVVPQMHQSLKAGGKLLIIDHNAIKGSGTSQSQTLHRIEDEFVKADLEKRGFRLIKKSPILMNKKDPLDISVFQPDIRRKTSRFVMLFEKI